MVYPSGLREAYAWLEYAPTGFEGDLPSAIAVLDMGLYKLFGRIGQVPADEIKVGMELCVQAVKTDNGRLSYVFNRP
jgi:uncharacterized OB-fold protein